MNASPDNNWAYVEAEEDDPFAEKPFQEVPENIFAEEEKADVTSELKPGKVISYDSGKTEPEEAQPAKEKADEEEAKKRAAHEAAEKQRRAEFDARQEAKKQAVKEQIARVSAMSNDEAMTAAIQRAGADTEKLVRRNMKEMVTEHIQTLCIEDSAFARLTLHPRKSMIRCFQYINRKAFEYVQDEMKASGITPGPGMQTYGADIPEDICYQWAEDYFRDPTVKEDEEQEERFVPKPYPGKSTVRQKTKKNPEKKPEKKAVKKTEPDIDREEAQLTFGQMAIA